MKRLSIVIVVLAAMFLGIDSYAAPVTSTNVVGYKTNSGSGSFDLTFQYSGNLGDWIVGTHDITDGFKEFDNITNSYDFTLWSGDIQEGMTIAYDEGIIDFAIKRNSDGKVWYLSELGNPHSVAYIGENTTFGSGYYDQIFINWSSLPIEFRLESANADNTNSAFHPVPIPATALLFCSSILGIVGIRRKISK